MGQFEFRDSQGCLYAVFRERPREVRLLDMPDEFFAPLLEYLAQVPSITGAIGHGVTTTGEWWIKFTIDIAHPLAWSVVQELGVRPQLPLLRREASNRVQARVPSAVSQWRAAGFPLLGH